MKMIEVIGGSGFIGTNLINALKDHYTVTNIDKIASEKLQEKIGAITFAIAYFCLGVQKDLNSDKTKCTLRIVFNLFSSSGMLMS